MGRPRKVAVVEEASEIEPSEATSQKATRPRRGPSQIPAKIEMTAPHGFIETIHNRGRFEWFAGEVITNPATIELLIERKASFKVIE